MTHIVLDFIEVVWNEGHIDRVPEFIAPTYTVNGEPYGNEGVQKNVAKWRTAFPNLHLSITEFVANGDAAAGLVRLTGTQEHQWNDVPSIGASFDVLEAGFWHIEGGLIVSGVFLADRTLIREQLASLDSRTQPLR